MILIKKLFLILLILGLVLVIGCSNPYAINRKAIENKDVSLCYKYADDNQRIVCFNTVAYNSGEYSDCDQPDFSSAGCHHRLWIKNKEPSEHCGTITDTELHDYCYLLLSARYNDSSLCGSIKSAEAQLICTANSVKWEQDPLICDQITTESIKENCYLKYAKTSFDESYCQKGTNTYRRDVCYKAIARASGNPKACEKVETGREFCIQDANKREQADRHYTPKECDQLGEEEMFNCQVYVARNESNPLLCDTLKDKEDGDNCYVIVAGNMEAYYYDNKQESFYATYSLD